MRVFATTILAILAVGPICNPGEYNARAANALLSVADAHWLASDCQGYRLNEAAVRRVLVDRGVGQGDLAVGGWANDVTAGELKALRRAADKHGLQHMCDHVQERFTLDWNRDFVIRK